MRFFRRLAEAVRNTVSPSHFTIFIRDGRPVVARGEPPPRFVSDLAELLRDLAITGGEIRARKRTDGIGIECTRIPEHWHQRIRNLWSIHEPRRRTR